MKLVLATLAVILSLVVLEQARSGVEIEHRMVGETPVTRFEQSGADGPVVVIAHGFAGSSEMMQGYALPLARAGYRVVVFDFLGHGRHSVPMSGDVTSPDGTTRLLVEQTEAVIDAVAEPGGRVALVGHSMATDVLVRVAAGRGDVETVALLSAFSQVIDADTPRSLLLVVGAGEPGLRDFALEAARVVDPQAEDGVTVSDGSVIRRAAVVPWTEHVSILQARAARGKVLEWLDMVYGRSSATAILPTGPAIIGLLVGLVVLIGVVARRLPERHMPAATLSTKQTALVLGLPILLAPVLAVMLDPGVMPVLVADYLALHLAIYGALQLALLRLWRVPFGPFAPLAFLYLLAGAAVFGFALDRYVANFTPTSGRLWIIAVLAIGATLYFVADARLAHQSTIWRRLAFHTGFLLSLVGAVALDFEGLFFLLMIAPVIVVFYLVFGTMGHAVSTRAGPLAPGLALGLVLAWSLGVSFPLFQG
ncbi:MAG: alpha/beta fold hydrolase [Pseudomonadota bacterium]